MPTVIFITAEGEKTELTVAEGMSAMIAARTNNIPGIEAECGGSLSCATCHVYVDPAIAPQIPPPSEQENEMLELVAGERQSNSRLSCQIIITPLLDGMTLRIPDTQY